MADYHNEAEATVRCRLALVAWYLESHSQNRKHASKSIRMARLDEWQGHERMASLCEVQSGLWQPPPRMELADEMFHRVRAQMMCHRRCTIYVHGCARQRGRGPCVLSRMSNLSLALSA